MEGKLESNVKIDEKSVTLGSRRMRTREKLEELRPVELEVEDITYQHAGVKRSDGETHFNVKVVSEESEGKSLVKRQINIWFVTT